MKGNLFLCHHLLCKQSPLASVYKHLTYCWANEQSDKQTFVRSCNHKTQLSTINPQQKNKLHPTLTIVYQNAWNTNNDQHYLYNHLLTTLSSTNNHVDHIDYYMHSHNNHDQDNNHPICWKARRNTPKYSKQTNKWNPKWESRGVLLRSPFRQATISNALSKPLFSTLNTWRRDLFTALGEWACGFAGKGNCFFCGVLLFNLLGIERTWGLSIRIYRGRGGW